MSPVRIKLSRARGFNLQAASRALNGLEAIRCARPGPHGNPFKIGCYARMGDPEARGPLRMSYSISLIGEQPGFTLISDAATAVEWFSRYAAGWSPEYLARKSRELGGRNLACWCGPDQPCHVDTLLELANQ